MNYTKYKPTQKEVAFSLYALDIMSGRRTRQPDYEAYRLGRRAIDEMVIPLPERDARMKELAERCGM